MIDIISVVLRDHMVPMVKINIVENLEQIDPHSRLAARQPNDGVSVLAGPLKCRLAALMAHLHTVVHTGVVHGLGLSLIHISEPTRPY